MPFPNQPALSDLLLRTYRLLEDVPALDSITAPISATPAGGDITITVNDPTQWPVGSRFEIDYEVFLVKTNTGSNPITVTRAYESSQAAAHTSGTQARRDPRFLKETVLEAINVVYGDWCSYWFPDLVWDTTTAGAFQPTRWIYQAPSDALAIRQVVWQIPGFQRYVDVAHSDINTYPTGIVASGFGFEIYERIGLPGTAVQVLYEKRWGVNGTNGTNFVNDTDLISANYPIEADDLIPLGAVLYIVGSRQVPRYRLDEVTFYREQNAPLPAAFNDAWLKGAYERWLERAHQIRTRRLNRVPQKVWVGLDGF